MSFTKVAPAGIGTEPGSSILIGDSLLHSTGIDIGSNTGIGVTIRKHGDATFTGIITASAFFGDGSGLEGVSSSGIGTPLSDDDTSDLNKIYYVNQELSIGSTVTVNHPSSAVASYTHYQDLVVTDDADFIVSDGDTFIPDVLGIRTSTSTTSAATGGRIRAGTITNAGANGAPNFPNGLTGTAGTFTGNLNVGGVLTYEDVTNVDSVGVITARSGIRIGATGANTLVQGTATGIGIGESSPLGKLHVKSADSGGSAHDGADELVVEGSGDSGISILSGASNNGRLNFGDSGDNNVGRLQYNHSDNYLAFYNTGTEKLRIGTAGQIGIAGANYGSSGQVLTSQGASSAVAWASLAVGKFASFAVVADANNTGNQNGGDFSSGAWRTRILDTEISDTDSIVSLSSNQFTLQAGNYFIVAWASALQVNGHQARLRDITNGATRAHGSSEYTGNGDYVTTKSWIYTRITPSSTTAYELQHRCQTSCSGVGFGNGSGDQWTQESNGDTYCMVTIFKEV